MLGWIVAAVAVGMLYVVMLGSGQHGIMYPRARDFWFSMGLAILIVLLLPNPWLLAGALWFLFLATLDTQVARKMTTIRQVTMVFGALGVAATLLPSSAIQPILWGVACAGVPLAAWASYSFWHGVGSYGFWAGPVFVYEQNLPTDPSHIIAGQGNTNHLEAVSCLIAAAGLGLATQQPWAGVLTAVALLPLVYDRIRRWRAGRRGARLLSQGDAYLCLLGAFTAFWWGSLAVFLGVCTALLVSLPLFWSERQGRVALWRMMLTRYWWRTGWLNCLLGHGIQTWGPAHNQHLVDHGLKNEQTWTYAHNDYVQTLFEYGIVGLVLVLGSAWSLLSHLPQGEAMLWPMGLMILLAGCFQGPWMLYHEGMFTLHIGPNDPSPVPGRMGVMQKTTMHGSHGVNWLTGLWIVLALVAGRP